MTTDARRKKTFLVSFERLKIWLRCCSALNNIAFLHIGRPIPRCTDRSNSFKFPLKHSLPCPTYSFKDLKFQEWELFLLNMHCYALKIGTNNSRDLDGPDCTLWHTSKKLESLESAKRLDENAKTILFALFDWLILS